MIDQATLKKLLRYDPTTGLFSRLINHSRCTPHWVSAGSRKPNGYVLVSVGGKRYQAHRLAWLYVYGRPPKGWLDHINRNPTDNRIANLREATCSQNRMNIALPSNNKTGHKGVYFYGKKWMAKIKLGGRLRSLGSFQTRDDAVRARRAAERKFFAEFAA